MITSSNGFGCSEEYAGAQTAIRALRAENERSAAQQNADGARMEALREQLAVARRMLDQAETQLHQQQDELIRLRSRLHADVHVQQRPPSAELELLRQQNETLRAERDAAQQQMREVEVRLRGVSLSAAGDSRRLRVDAEHLELMQRREAVEERLDRSITLRRHSKSSRSTHGIVEEELRERHRREQAALKRFAESERQELERQLEGQRGECRRLVERLAEREQEAVSLRASLESAQKCTAVNETLHREAEAQKATVQRELRTARTEMEQLCREFTTSRDNHAREILDCRAQNNALRGELDLAREEAEAARRAEERAGEALQQETSKHTRISEAAEQLALRTKALEAEAALVPDLRRIANQLGDETKARQRVEKDLRRRTHELEEADERLREERRKADTALSEERQRAQQEAVRLGRDMQALHDTVAGARRENEELAARVLDLQRKVSERDGALAQAKEQHTEGETLMREIKLRYAAELDAARSSLDIERETHRVAVTRVADLEHLLGEARLATETIQRSFESAQRSSDAKIRELTETIRSLQAFLRDAWVDPSRRALHRAEELLST
eukprot:Hpha_TRINITY_DN14049_c0_g1::TRINITY_DN14049_c0_g1_i1::g.43906::m.43906